MTCNEVLEDHTILRPFRMLISYSYSFILTYTFFTIKHCLKLGKSHSPLKLRIFRGIGYVAGDFVWLTYTWCKNWVLINNKNYSGTVLSSSSFVHLDAFKHSS